MRLRELLFGRPPSPPSEVRRFEDPRLGAFTATVRPGSERGWHDWIGQQVIPGGSQPTRFSLSGDGLAPHPRLVEEASAVLDDLADLRTRVSDALRSHDDSESVEDFHLALISDWDEIDDVLVLNFVPLRAPGLRMQLEFEWSPKGGQVAHQVKLRARPPDVPGEGSGPSSST